MERYFSRSIEDLIRSRLQTHGAVLVTGPKAVGKTTTARCLAASAVRLDRDQDALQGALVDPALVLEGECPRLIDEYHLAPGIWNAVRGRIDDAAAKGLFLLTGSAAPKEDPIHHTGARRIAPVEMRTMSFAERGFSEGHLSVGALLNGERPTGSPHRMSIQEVMDALVVGGWPDNLGRAVDSSCEANVSHIDLIVNSDIHRVDGEKRDRAGVRRLLASYARNTATDASLRTLGRMGENSFTESTLHDHLAALRRLYLVEDQGAWKPDMRSRVRVAATPKRHLADPSLAVAALGLTPERLLGPEIKLAGFLFESQVVHDLRIYAQPHRGSVYFYRDNKGLEVDAIIEAPDGRWIAFEVKLGHHRVEEGVKNLLSLRKKLSDDANELCCGLVVVVASAMTYTRPEDGVIITSPVALGP
jgi:uncharacterized protein